jgi:hypothetical protein
MGWLGTDYYKNSQMKKGTKHKKESVILISDGMEGNKNAEKWDEQTVTELLTEMWHDVQDSGMVYINTLLLRHDLYKNWWSDIKEKYQNHHSVSVLFKKIETKIENNLILFGLSGKANPALTIFLLKNKHGFRDDKHLHQTIDVNHQHDLSKLSTKELKQLKEIQQKMQLD